ncbi:MAG: hypothetical protein KF813_10750 [Trueperaceae bacterium]|nr:hypothetical protein [Trueperaceae bacterium]
MIDVPFGHELAGANGRWYVFGYSDGAPLVPDVSLYFAASSSTDEAIATLFPGSAVVAVERCFVAELLLVTSRRRLPDGTAALVERYVLPVEAGIIVAERYESFDWEYFEPVAKSLRTYREAQ